MEIKARAEILFFTDPFEKPTVILTGRWSAKDVNKASGLLARQFKRYIRQIQKGEVNLEEAPVEVEEEEVEASEATQTEEEEVSDGR